MWEVPASSVSWPVRIALLGSGLVVPIVSLRVARELSDPAWQSGELSAYASLFLANTALVFSPFLAYAIGSFVLVLFAGDRAARHFAIRFGVYSGILLCLQFILAALAAVGGIEGVTGNEVALILACGLGGTLVPLGLWRAGVKFARRWGNHWVWRCLVCGELVFILAIAITPSPVEIVAAAAYATVAVALIATPFWALATYVAVSVFVYRRYGGRGKYRLSNAMCLMTWLATYLGTLRISVSRAVEQYAQLPTTPPKNCYVATAAARGHPTIVRSERWLAPDGSLIAVNGQMRRLKTAELALAAVSRPLHVALRGGYDRVGPRLARWLSHPLSADAAYLLLKPVEWLVTVLMLPLAPDFNLLASRIYWRDA